MKKTGRPKGSAPHLWISGPDPLEHKYYQQWLQQRNQAQWRGEAWTLTWPQWRKIWGDQITQRGRGKNCLSMVRIDFTEPWSETNVRVVTRQDHARYQSQITQALKARHEKSQNDSLSA